MFNLVIALCAVVAVSMIVWGGFQYMTSFSPQVKGDGLEKVKGALLGLILILSSYIILRTIDPRLVEIPSTLVKPLSINYTPEGNNLLNNLAIQAEQYREKFTDYLQEVNSSEQKIKDFKKQKQELQGQSGSDLSKVCPEGPSGDTELEQICVEWRKIDHDENLVASEQAKIIAFGVMNAGIYKCLSAGAVDNDTNQKCASNSLAEITAKQAEAVKQLEAMGAYDKVQQVKDYATYAKTVVMMNTELQGLIKSPYFNVISQTIQNINTAAGTAIGASLGGSKGAVGGFVASQFVNASLIAHIHEDDWAGAQTAIKSIKQVTANQIAHISDPQIKEMLQNQSQAIVKAIGG